MIYSLVTPLRITAETNKIPKMIIISSFVEMFSQEMKEFNEELLIIISSEDIDVKNGTTKAKEKTSRKLPTIINGNAVNN